MTQINQTSPLIARQERLAKALQSADLDALALNPGPTLTYLTGLHFHLMERPTVLVFTAAGEAYIVLAELEAAKLSGLPYPLHASTYGEDPLTWGSVFQHALKPTKLGQGSQIAVEPTQLRVLELRLLEAALIGATFVDGGPFVAGLRMIKDSSEIKAMRKAVDIAQLALQATLPSIRIGMTEKELAAELTLHLLRGGSESKLPFEPIVSSGPNSANPHAVPSDRRLQAGDLLVIDWGASFEGYLSDLTRTFALGEIEPEFARIAQIVHEANAAGRQVAAPKIPAGDVDSAARSVIERTGYGQYFIHRTGHGLGMEGHEEPYIRKDNPQLLAPGMSFTIEPGIYLPDRGGVRIEDDVVISATGCEVLSTLPRDLIRVG